MLYLCLALVLIFMTESFIAIIWLSALGQSTDNVVDLAKIIGASLLSILTVLVRSAIRDRERRPPK